MSKDKEAEPKTLKFVDVKVWVQDTPKVPVKGFPEATKSTGHFELKKAVLVEGLVAELQKRVKIHEHEQDMWYNAKTKGLIEAYNEVLVLLGAKELSDEFMETLRKSQEDKKAGRVRPYEEIAKECGLGTKKEKQKP